MFDFFRNRKSEVMALLVVVAMLTFVASDWLSGCNRQTRDGGATIVAQFGQRPITAKERESIQQEREQVRTILRRAAEAGGAQAAFPAFINGNFPMLAESPQDVNVNVTRVLALDDYAQRVGIEATSDDVSQALSEAAGGKLTPQVLEETFRPTPARAKKDENRRNREEQVMTQTAFVSAMKREIRLQRARSALSVDVSFQTAATPYDVYYGWTEPTGTRVQLELCRLPVAKFVDPKAVPTDAELQATYERYKDTVADPVRKRVGFKAPPRADLQYLAIKPEKYFDQVKITDEQCQAHYDAHKLEYRRTPVAPPAPPPAPPSKPADKPAEKPTPAPPKSMPEKAPAEKPKAEPPKAAPADKEKAKGKAAALPTLLPLAGVLAQNAKAKEAPMKEVPPVTAPPMPAKEAPKADAGKAAEKKAEDKQPEEKRPIPPPPAAVEPKDDIKPFAEVKEEIRKLLQRDKAALLAIEALEKRKKADLEGYGDRLAEARALYRRAHPEDAALANFQPPAMPKSLADIAKDFGTEAKSIANVTQDELGKRPELKDVAELPFMVFSDYTQAGRDFTGQPLAKELQGVVLTDQKKENVHLVWVAKSNPGGPLPLAEVKDKVTELWRLEQAVKKAREAADKLAEAARKADGKLSEGAKGTDYVISRPKEFVRQTALRGPDGNTQRIPTVTLEGVPDVTSAMLDAAYQLEEGAIGVAPGAPENGSVQNVYVIKCVERKPAAMAAFQTDYLTVQRQIRQLGSTRLQAERRAEGEFLMEVGVPLLGEKSAKGAPEDDAADGQ